MPKTTTAPAKTARVSEKVITTTEKPPVDVPLEAERVDDDADFQPWTKDFWPYIASLTAADWKDHTVRLYRYPLGEKKPRELGRYLVRYDVDNPLQNEAQLATRYGGGQYDALVHRGRKLILSDFFEIEGPSKNPDAAPAVVAGGNELASTLQVVLQNLERLKSTAPADQAPKYQEMVSMITAISSALPKAATTGVTELVTALSALDQLRGGDNRRNDLKETLETLRDLGIIGERSAAAEKKNKVEEIKEILEIADMMRGGGSGGRRDWVTTLIDAAPTIIEKAGGVLDRASEISKNQARIAEARRVTVTERVLPSQAAPAPTAPAATSSAPPVTPINAARTVAPLETEPAPGAAAQPAPPATATAQPANTSSTIECLPPNFDWVKARTVELFRAGKTGDQVAEFMDNLDKQLGDQLGSLPRPQLEAFIANDPILREITAAPRYAAFLDECQSYFTGEPAGVER